MPAKRQPGYAASTIAKLLGVSPRRLTQLVAEGIAIRVGRGRYDLTKTVQNYIAYLKSQVPERESKRYDDQKMNERIHEGKHRVNEQQRGIE